MFFLNIRQIARISGKIPRNGNSLTQISNPFYMKIA